MKIESTVFLFSVCLLLFAVIMVTLFSCTNNAASAVKKEQHHIHLHAPINPVIPASQPAPIPRGPPLTEKPVVVNASTRGQYSYQQIGILYKEVPDGESKVLPLYGRPTYMGSQKWNYYTQTDGYNPIKLSLQKRQRDCMDQIGCDEINDGDEIYVPELNNGFRVRIYQTSVPTYIPVV